MPVLNTEKNAKIQDNRMVSNFRAYTYKNNSLEGPKCKCEDIFYMYLKEMSVINMTE